MFEIRNSNTEYINLVIIISADSKFPKSTNIEIFEWKSTLLALLPNLNANVQYSAAAAKYLNRFTEQEFAPRNSRPKFALKFFW